jgi:hypothetical protein
MNSNDLNSQTMAPLMALALLELVWGMMLELLVLELSLALLVYCQLFVVVSVHFW